MINNKFLEFLDITIQEKINKSILKLPYCIVRSGIISGTPTTTATVQFVGDSFTTPNIRFINGLSLSNGDKVNVLVYNNSIKNTSMIILEKM